MSPPDSPTQLVVNVALLLEEAGARRRLVFDEWVEGLQTELVRIPRSRPVHFDLILESMDEGIIVRGTLAGSYVAQCRRCLEESPDAFSIDVTELYRRPSTEVWEEGYAVQGETVDLHPLVRDNILLEMPRYPLCREDCLGLCSSCGQNRNRGECSCARQDGDDRWSQLRRLLPHAEG